jgi:Ca2+-binding EF-hand superfamily protein
MAILSRASQAKPRVLRLPLALGLIVLAATAVRADKSASKPSSAGDAALFDRLDANHDGTISASEISAENRSLFDRLLRRGDSDHDRALSRKEFLASLVPTRPEKIMEEKEPATLPGADAIRYLLLTMDANRNARIEKEELPEDLKGVDAVFDRIDRNANGTLERQELSRTGGAMSTVATRYIKQQKIDLDKELAKLKKSQGEEFGRFEEQPIPLEQLKDAKQARKMFARLDENGDGKLETKEVPEPIRERIQRLIRIADRDGDKKLGESEFVTATERIAKFLQRGETEEMRKDNRKADKKAKARESAKKTAKN